MRECRGLVDSLVGYVQRSVETGKAEDKGVENAVCTLRNLSFQLYTEIPPSASMRLEGPSRGQYEEPGDVIGCFTPQSKKAKQNQMNDQLTFSEVAKDPKGMEWLWHPQIVSMYNRVLQHCEMNSSTREAAAGALQNITAGDKRWASVLSRVAMEQERILPTILDNLRTNNDQELRSLTGFLRNLSRYARNKDDMATKVVKNVLVKLPSDSSQTEPSSDVIINICGVLNNLVMGSSVAARDIAFFDGLQKLVSIKNNRNSCSREKAAKAATTVLGNMYTYTKLHRDYKLVSRLPSSTPSLFRCLSSAVLAHRYHPCADSGGAKMNTRCPPKRVPSAARFFTRCELTVQPPQSYSVGGQRSSGQLTGKPTGARPDYRGRWCEVSRGHPGRPNPLE
ncbi:UNVERIFIED_CONTAM: hypothetical protein FKN15_077552 [Acipenser sinensis]